MTKFGICKEFLHTCLTSTGERVHLLYFGMVAIESHYYFIAAAVCLAIGILAELVGEPA